MEPLLEPLPASTGEVEPRKTWLQAAPTILHPNSTGEAVLPNVFQNSSSSTKKAAPPEEPEPGLFLKEPELCQTGPWVCLCHDSNSTL